MSIQETNEASELAPFIGDDYDWTAEEGARTLINYLELHGGTLYVLESSYWGNEAGVGWEEMFIAEPVVKTDNGGIKVKNVVRAGKVLSILNRYHQAAREIELLEDEEAESNYKSFAREHWEDGIGDAILDFWNGLSVDVDKSDWFPASKIKYEVSRRGRDDHVIFKEGDSKERGVESDATTSITGTTLVSTKYQRYEKLEINIPYRDDQNPKEYFDWDDHKFSAKYIGDDFQCWTANKMPRTIAKILAEQYGSCAVDETLLEEYDQ